jgi:trimeric autotransporter adhesin
MNTQRTTTQRKFFLGGIFLATIFALAQVAVVHGQTSTFTYQGRFTDGGTAANGTYDMQFKLFDGAGNQIGSTTTNSAVLVSSGVFTVQLDYGAAGFPGADRFLEIGVRQAGNGEAYTVLAPRQPLTSTPYAIRAGATTTADTATTAVTATNATQLGGLPANQYVQTSDSRLTDARTPSAGSSNYIQNSISPQVASFNITGNGASAGTLSAAVVNANQYNIFGQRVLAVNASNTFVGFEAGIVNTGGANAFFGNNAGGSNGTGFANSFFGFQSGISNQTGNNNTFVGAQAGSSSQTADNNSFFGTQAGAKHTSGAGNSFFGYRAGSDNDNSNSNSFFGTKAGEKNTGDANSFFGNEAGAKNSGNNNAFFGESTGTHNTTGAGNSFFGGAAGQQNLGGSHNTFVGYLAGLDNTSASDNSFFGANAGQQNTTGARNSFFGVDAGALNQTASDNASFGHKAGWASRGSVNAFFGSDAGGDNSTGFANSFFGMSAGGQNTGGFNNAFFGRGSGNENVSGNNNTTVGAFADLNSAALMFATAIGSGARVGTSNTVVLGRNNDTVQVPGTLTVSTLGTVGLTSVCRNALNQISVCSSSLRYKKDLQPFTRGLALLNQLKPLTFKWKADNSNDLGFGAEEVAAVEPLLVIRNDKGEVEGVKYDRITAVLVNSVKEQQEQIKQQQSQINSLKQLVCRRHQRAAVCK